MSNEYQKAGRDENSPSAPAGTRRFRTSPVRLSKEKHGPVLNVILALLSVFPIAILTQMIFSSTWLGLPAEYVAPLTTTLSIAIGLAFIFLLARVTSRQQQRERQHQIAQLRSTEKVLFQDVELDLDNLMQQEPYNYGK